MNATTLIHVQRGSARLRAISGDAGGRKSESYITGMTHERRLHSVPDDELLQRLTQLTGDSRGVEADLVAHVGEVDVRRLYLREASPSMFSYCTDVLHLSEAEAYLRINCARIAREHPVLLTMLADGRLHLSGIVKLAPRLTVENRDQLLERATHRSKRQIEELLAELFPRPDSPALVRKLPERHPSIPPVARSLMKSTAPEVELRPDAVHFSSAAAPPSARSAIVEPLAPARYKVQFTASSELRDKLQRLQALMRTRIPDADLAAIVEDAVTEKLARLEARRFGKAKAPRKQVSTSDTTPGSRYIPAAVKRVVTERDQQRCRYEDRRGRRCSARGQLEYHHRHLFAFGGDRSPDNIALMCKRHNRFLAEHDYGVSKMARYRQDVGSGSESEARNGRSVSKQA
jgi:hypothetical protein